MLYFEYMEIIYLGHSCFKLKGKEGTVVTDPYHSYVGFSLPSVSADLVTVSHHHQDHDYVAKINGTARRAQPFIIDRAGEYEVGGISVFGSPSWHDEHGGVERGQNTIFTIFLDGLRICHLGDLGHELSQEQLVAIGSVDMLLCPVGGVFTIDAKQAIKTIYAIEPSVVIPMHYQTAKHDPKVFGELGKVEDFLQEYGVEVKPVAKLDINKDHLPEETELVILTS